MAPCGSVRYRRAGPGFTCDAATVPQVQPGDYVVAPTPRGPQVGWVLHTFEEPPTSADAPLQTLLRLATSRDLVLWQMAQHKALEALVNARAQAARVGLKSVRIILVEVSLDHQTLTFEYFTEENPEQSKAWKRFVQGLEKVYPNRNLEFVRLGPRDAAKWEGGLGACGMERCCTRFMTGFQPVQMRMAKDQNLALGGTDITGSCGRLRCCLAFEQPIYQELLAQLPRLKARISTPRGQGKVVEVRPLQGTVVVELLEDRTRLELSRAELEDLLPPCADCPHAQG